jgi:hypothetical protein
VDALKRGRRRSGGTAGAIYVEFLIAFMPFFVFFLGLWQLSIIYTARLMIDHAAMCAARAAGVLMGEPVNMTDPTAGPSSQSIMTAGRSKLVTTAAELAVLPLVTDGTISRVELAYPSTWAGGSASSFQPLGPGIPRPSAVIYVRVTGYVQCNILLVGRIVCAGGMVPIKSEAAFPTQGASYL